MPVSFLGMPTTLSDRVKIRPVANVRRLRYGLKPSFDGPVRWLDGPAGAVDGLDCCRGSRVRCDGWDGRI